MSEEIKKLKTYLAVHLGIYGEDHIANVLEARITQLETKNQKHTIMNTAKHVKEVTVIDPDSKGEVAMSVFKHNESGGMFAVDSTFLEQTFEIDDDIIIADPLNMGRAIKLTGL